MKAKLKSLGIFLLFGIVCFIGWQLVAQSNQPPGGNAVKLTPLQSTTNSAHGSSFSEKLQRLQNLFPTPDRELHIPQPPDSLMFAPPPGIYGADFLNTHKLELDAVEKQLKATNDMIQASLLKRIEDARQELLNTNLDMTRRWLLKDQLQMSQAQLTNYYARGVAFGIIARMHDNLRADHRTNVQLWANLRLAEYSKDSQQIAQAKQALANYLAKQLSQKQGKEYPADVSFDEIMVQYREQFEKANFDETK